LPTKNVNVPHHHSEFVDRLVATGRYGDASDVFCACVRLLEQRAEEARQRVALLRGLAAEGFDQIDQGQGIVLSDRRRLGARVAKLGCEAGKFASRRESGSRG
jgi:antitoxin ParD1/3/4